MKLQEQIHKIRTLMELEIKKETLMNLLYEFLPNQNYIWHLYYSIEETLNDKFTREDFENEIKYSGPAKEISNKFDDAALTAFKNMQKDFPSIKIRDNSLRDALKQKNTFINAAIENGGKIKSGLRRAALPGFSQHHTGKAFDVKNYTNLPQRNKLKQYGFILPYAEDSGFRMAEPWHIYYEP